jgi:hypothetical protein
MSSSLDQFSLVTGLVINFSKRTMVPMHTDPLMVSELQPEQGCRVGGSPRLISAWLWLVRSSRLPTSSSDLKNQQVSFWLVLYQVVSTRAYCPPECCPRRTPGLCDGHVGAMVGPALCDRCALASFPLELQGQASGAKCLVAWAQVCRHKENVDLSINCLTMRNACMQVKRLQRLHSSTSLP